MKLETATPLCNHATVTLPAGNRTSETEHRFTTHESWRRTLPLFRVRGSDFPLVVVRPPARHRPRPLHTFAPMGKLLFFGPVGHSRSRLPAISLSSVAPSRSAILAWSVSAQIQHRLGDISGMISNLKCIDCSWFSISFGVSRPRIP